MATIRLSAEERALIVALREKRRKPNTFFQNVISARVPCAYLGASCAGKTFAPNGVGSKQHTTCAPGTAALQAARKG